MSAADHDNLLVLAARHSDADIRPLRRLATAAEDPLQLRDGQFGDRVGTVDKDGQCVVAHDEFHRLVPAMLLGQFYLLVFHLAAGIGNIDSAVDEGGDARSGTAAGYRNRHVGGDLLVGFRLRPGRH